MQKGRFCVRLCYDKGLVYRILQHTFNMTNTKIDLIKINPITETNDNAPKININTGRG